MLYYFNPLKIIETYDSAYDCLGDIPGALENPFGSYSSQKRKTKRDFSVAKVWE